MEYILKIRPAFSVSKFQELRNVIPETVLQQFEFSQFLNILSIVYRPV
jgi:hypothetical protein